MDSKAQLERIEMSQLERLEFTGTRKDDGTVEALGRTYNDWPEAIEVAGVRFRLEETDDRISK